MVIFELTPLNQTLILRGASATGSFEEGYYYMGEDFYVHEAESILEFCKWIDKEIGGAGRANIQTLYNYWKGDTSLENEVKAIKAEIERINSHFKL